MDVRIARVAGRQHNRISRAQLHEVGCGDDAVRHRVSRGRLVPVHEAVFACAPALDDDRGRWMAATLTAPSTFLSHASAGACWGYWTKARHVEIVTRVGSGGPRTIEGLLVHRSEMLRDHVTHRFAIPITTAERTLLDLAPHLFDEALARAVREALRLKVTTVAAIVETLTAHRGRRGTRRLALAVARYSGLPVQRARSGAEIVALEQLRDAGRTGVRLNHLVAGDEADLVWLAERVIIEIDGPQFHLDAGEDGRKQAIWEAAGFEVRRLSTVDLFASPRHLLALAPP